MSDTIDLVADGDTDHDDGLAAAWRERSRGRRIAFRVASALTALLVLAMFSFGLLELGFMWLPGATLAELFAEDIESVGELELHRVHFLSIGIVAWVVVPAILVQLRKPWRRVAPMLQLVVMAVAGAILFGLSGTLREWLVEEWLLLVPVLVVAALHPRARDLVRRPRFDPTLGAMAAAAAIPWTVSVIANARLQLANAAGDPHAEPEHWALVALMGIAIMASATLGASDHDGWRLPAWVAALASLVYGTHSVVFPEAVSAASTGWAVAAVVWGVAFGVRIVQRSRREQGRLR